MDDCFAYDRAELVDGLSLNLAETPGSKRPVAPFTAQTKSAAQRLTENRRYELSHYCVFADDLPEHFADPKYGGRVSDKEYFGDYLELTAVRVTSGDGHANSVGLLHRELPEGETQLSAWRRYRVIPSDHTLLRLAYCPGETFNPERTVYVSLLTVRDEDIDKINDAADSCDTPDSDLAMLARAICDPAFDRACAAQGRRLFIQPGWCFSEYGDPWPDEPPHPRGLRSMWAERKLAMRPIHNRNSLTMDAAVEDMIVYANGISRAAVLSRTNSMMKGMMGPAETGTIYGKSGIGKSFVALDISFHLAHELPYMGRKTRRTPTLYCCLEGVDGFQKRVLALIDRYGDPGEYFGCFDLQVYLAKGAAGDAGTEKLIEAAKYMRTRTGADSCLVIIDTKARAVAGDDENSAADMASYAEKRSGAIAQRPIPLFLRCTTPAKGVLCGEAPPSPPLRTS